MEKARLDWEAVLAGAIGFVEMIKTGKVTDPTAYTRALKTLTDSGALPVRLDVGLPWSKKVRDTIAGICMDWHEDVLEFGPGHIVFSDYNWEDGNIDFCLKACDDPEYRERFSDDEIAVCRRALRALLAIPESQRVTKEYEAETYRSLREQGVH